MVFTKFPPFGKMVGGLCAVDMREFLQFICVWAIFVVEEILLMDVVQIDGLIDRWILDR